jgi:E3 ubiquitin-protein ligase RNF103
LDTRGISYINAVEKSDLTELVRASGNVSQQEITNFNNNNNNNLYIETQIFTDSNDFYYNWFNNSNNDNSVLVVSVIPSSGEPINLQLWRQLVATLSQFGIKTGIFDCSHEPSVCKSRKWISPKLVLISPGVQLYKSANRKLYHITQEEMSKMVESPSNVQKTILNWLSAELAVHVQVLRTEYNLNYNWLQQQRKICKLLFITTLKTGTPLILSSLAVKFRRRIEFAMFRVNNNNDITKKSGSLSIPSYMIIKPNDKRYYYNYGQNYGEFISYESMDSFLTTFTLELNDLFNNSFFLLNIAIGLQLFVLTNSSFNISNHFYNWIRSLLVHNIVLLLIIWPIITFISSKYISYHFNEIYQMLVTTQVAAVIRYDYQHYYSVKALIITFITFAVILTANSFKQYPKVFSRFKKILLLKMRLIKPEKNMCTVCFDDTIEGHEQNIILQECEHHFHKKCIVNWFTKSSSMSCPNCRTGIDVNRYLTEAEIRERNRIIENSIIDALIQFIAMRQNLNINNT